MIIPYDVWYIIFKFVDRHTLLVCRTLCKKISKICNNVIKVSSPKGPKGPKRPKGIDWERISSNRELSESFIREFRQKVNWEYISACQKLSESFIQEFQDQVCWVQISRHQKLSENFSREFQHKVD